MININYRGIDLLIMLKIVMEVVPWLKVYAVMLIIVFTIITVNAMLKKLPFVIVNAIMQKKLPKQLVKHLNADRNISFYLFC